VYVRSLKFTFETQILLKQYFSEQTYNEKNALMLEPLSLVPFARISKMIYELSLSITFFEYLPMVTNLFSFALFASSSGLVQPISTLVNTKSVFEYDNYREFLKDSYVQLKASDPNFSFRFFSKLAGFKSSSVLKMIIDGKRSIAPESIDKFAQALKMNAQEASFFRILVLFNQAKSAAEKQGYAQALLFYNEFKKSHPLTESQYNFYAHWYNPVIWELSGVPGFKNDPEWVAKTVLPNITVSQAKKALQDLEQLGLLVRSSSGTLEKSLTNLRTEDEVASSSIAQWHRIMIQHGVESIDSIPREKREISSVTCAMSFKTAKKFKEKIQKLRIELMEEAAQDQSPNMVYQLNFQLFPHAEISDEVGDDNDSDGDKEST
jgi:uncharacterized protein (TIGR02147 family)